MGKGLCWWLLGSDRRERDIRLVAVVEWCLCLVSCLVSQAALGHSPMPPILPSPRSENFFSLRCPDTSVLGGPQGKTETPPPAGGQATAAERSQPA